VVQVLARAAGRQRMRVAAGSAGKQAAVAYAVVAGRVSAGRCGGGSGGRNVCAMEYGGGRYRQ